jgi:chemotaxis response regulator CheB
MSANDVTQIAFTHVAAERADDFEEFLRSTVVPAVAAHRSAQSDRWHLLRSAGAAEGSVLYAFLFEGADADGWNLLPVLKDALGSEAAEKKLAELDGMMTAQQDSWTFTPVALG